MAAVSPQKAAAPGRAEDLDEVWAHDRHAREPFLDAEQLEWTRNRPSGTPRVIETTCWCSPLVYELRSAGGLRHIVRICRIPTAEGPPSIRYTIPLPAAQTDAVWRKLLNGDVK